MELHWPDIQITIFCDKAVEYACLCQLEICEKCKSLSPPTLFTCNSVSTNLVLVTGYPLETALAPSILQTKGPN